MAGVKSLAIRGIRSFGPDQDDEQRISFESPLTLILGQNGCGKTTIIECLRYAITGQMPPGSRNECFVHDAKVNRSTEVMGQVKLKIVNAKDKLLEVSRSMRVTALAKKKTKFQTLDSFLSVVDEHGNTKDISSRCADLDRFMYEELGVPKAILNSVIFCHQEDSSWPLDEGKKVKERFDEIFDADKYSDCFDRLRKIRKEYAMKLKLLEQEVAFMFEKKQDLDKKKLDVVNTESEISEVEIKMGELTQQLKPINEKLLAIEKLQNDLVTYESKKEKSKTKLEHSQTQEKELLVAIKNVFEGTTEELEQKINSYGTTAKANQKELEASYRKNTNFNKEEEKIANEKTNNEVKFSKLILLESQNQEKIDKRKELIGETAKLAEIDPPEIESNEDAAKGIEVLNEKIKSLRNELKEMKAEGDAEEKKQQEVVDASLVELSCHRQKISSKEAEIQKVKKDIVKLEKEIAAAEKSKEKLDVLEKSLNTAEEAYTQVENELNTEECQKEITEDEKVIESYETELEELSKKVTLLQKQSAKLKERDMIDEQVKQKEKQFAILKNKHRSALVDLLGSMPEEKFAVSIKTYETGVRKEVDAMKRKLKERQMEITRLEADRKHVRESLNNRRTELTNAEDKMYQACGTQTYEATLAKLNSNVEKLQDEQSILNSSMFLIAKYKTQLKDNSCCPLCSRGFENESEVSDLISQLTTQVMNVPSNLEKVSEELQRTSAKKDELLSMKSLNDKIKSLKEKEIPELETRLADIDKSKAAATEASEELTMALLEPEQKMQTAKDIQGEMPLIDKIIQEIKSANKDLEKAKAQITDVDTELSLDDATAKQADLRQKLSTLRTRIKDAQKKLNDHAKKLRTLGDKKNKLKEQFLDLQRKVQEIVNLQERRKKCDEDIEKLTVETKELDDGTEAFKQALKTQEEIKAEIIAKHRGLIETKNTFINSVVSSFEKVKSVDLEIKQHKNKNIPLEMEKIKEANNALMDKQKQIMIDRDALTKRIDALKDELAKQEIYKRDLDDNLKLRKAKADIETCQKELAEIDEKLSGVNTDMLSEKETLIQDQTRLFREKATDMGKLEVLKTNLKHNKIELKKVENKEIDKKYRERFYELHVTKAIDKDVRDYSVALEKCLMEFHKEKMENINLIIRQMWRKIYRGNDIDYIEIKTEGSMTENSERRKYDYRVVQCKNGVEIDMRGRCSAGQKVLACLIIRLALAESFSSKFGILALDEPTTNLDQENVTSLCAALGEIVRERMKQKNFMFIIITHDREFIESLGNIDKVSYFYEVSRNDEGKSRIKRIRFT